MILGGAGVLDEGKSAQRYLGKRFFQEKRYEM
jgi:hypothetical protein